jgi:hypothetical protein
MAVVLVQLQACATPSFAALVQRLLRRKHAFLQGKALMLLFGFAGITIVFELACARKP